MDICEPNDMAYTYSGYAPLSIRYIERLLTIGANDSECTINNKNSGSYFRSKAN